MTSFEVNGKSVTLHQNDQTPLIDALRNELGLRATRLGCGLGQCGACHVMVDGQSVPACDTPLWAVQNKQVLTVESAKDQQHDAARNVLRKLQDAFVQEQAAQCGFCTSGILMSATVLLQQHAEPTLAQIHDALDRHLCRCGAHLRIVRAIQSASRALREEVAA